MQSLANCTGCTASAAIEALRVAGGDLEMALRHELLRLPLDLPLLRTAVVEYCAARGMSAGELAGRRSNPGSSRKPSDAGLSQPLPAPPLAAAASAAPSSEVPYRVSTVVQGEAAAMVTDGEPGEDACGTRSDANTRQRQRRGYAAPSLEAAASMSTQPAVAHPLRGVHGATASPGFPPWVGSCPGMEAKTAQDIGKARSSQVHTSAEGSSAQPSVGMQGALPAFQGRRAHL
jgi:hypothetical protein